MSKGDPGDAKPRFDLNFLDIRMKIIRERATARRLEQTNAQQNQSKAAALRT